MKTKTFDCVEMKHQAQERIRKELEGRSRQEELEYWQKIAEDAARRSKAAPPTPADASAPASSASRQRRAP